MQFTSGLNILATLIEASGLLLILIAGIVFVAQMGPSLHFCGHHRNWRSRNNRDDGNSPSDRVGPLRFHWVRGHLQPSRGSQEPEKNTPCSNFDRRRSNGSGLSRRVALRLREHEPAKGQFRIPPAIPVIAVFPSLGLLGFVPAESILRAGAFAAVGFGFVPFRLLRH